MTSTVNIRRRHSVRAASLVSLVAMFLAVLLACSSSRGKETLTVFAAASLTQSFEEVAAAFEEAHPQISVKLAFDGSQRLRVQLGHGAQADIFASADERQMSLAQESGLLAGEAVTFATNTLVVAVSSQAETKVKSLTDLAQDDVRLVLAHPEVPAGRYAVDVIELMAKAPGFGPQYSAQILRNVVSHEPNVRGVLQKVALGEADSGFVYASDVVSAENISVLVVPEEANVAAIYPVAALRFAAEKKSAETFIQFLTSPQGQRILHSHGFGPIPSLAGSNSSGSPDFRGEKPASAYLESIHALGDS